MREAGSQEIAVEVVKPETTHSLSHLEAVSHITTIRVEACCSTQRKPCQPSRIPTLYSKRAWQRSNWSASDDGHRSDAEDPSNPFYFVQNPFYDCAHVDQDSNIPTEFKKSSQNFVYGFATVGESPKVTLPSTADTMKIKTQWISVNDLTSEP